MILCPADCAEAGVSFLFFFAWGARGSCAWAILCVRAGLRRGVRARADGVGAAARRRALQKRLWAPLLVRVCVLSETKKISELLSQRQRRHTAPTQTDTGGLKSLQCRVCEKIMVQSGVFRLAYYYYELPHAYLIYR